MDVVDLRCQTLVNPFGINDPKPHLSWRIQAAEQDVRQSAYQIVAARTQEDLTGGNSTGKPLVSHVTTLLSHRVNFPPCNVMSSSMFQGVTPDVVLLDHRATIKEMLFRPLDRLRSGNCRPLRFD